MRPFCEITYYYLFILLIDFHTFLYECDYLRCMFFCIIVDFFIDAYLEEFLCVGGQCGGVGDHVSPVGGVVTLIITSSQRNRIVENKNILGVCIETFVVKLVSWSYDV